MASIMSPGVYVKEVSSGVKPIAGVGTSTGAFVGFAEKGVIGKAVLVTNWSQFVKEFGSFSPDEYLAYAVYSFFAEGGTTCYVVRTANEDHLKCSFKKINDVNDAEAITITAIPKGTWGDRISILIENPSDETLDETVFFKLTVQYKEASETEYEPMEVFDGISIEDIDEKINDVSAFIVASDSSQRPANSPSDSPYTLTEGNDGVEDADFIGDTVNKKGIHAFDEVDDINIVAIPDIVGLRVDILKCLNYCKERKDCFFIADPPIGLKPTDIIDFKQATGDYEGNAFNSSYGALYYPWVSISDPVTRTKKDIPPSGAVAGTYAHTDSTRGVHKAPAGISDGYLDSVIGVESIITKGEHDQLHPKGINVIRSFPGSGICIWGALTLSTDAEWKYINIRRLFLFLEESIDEATQWVVFEPNTPALWGNVIRNITAFLLRTWRDGALFGNSPEEAFFVKVDAENNPPEVRDAGQLIIEVGVAPVKPAEFVIIKISQKTLSK